MRTIKWFQCLNDNLFEAYWDCVRVATATAPPCLEPHFVYDGPDNPKLDWLKARGVTIHRHRVTIAQQLIDYYRPKSNACCAWCKDKGAVALGAFLRLEIPLLCDDEYVLYTDSDVMFTGRPLDKLFCKKPPLICASTQDSRTDWSAFNSGVLLMNLPGLRKELPRLPDCLHNDYDQGSLANLVGHRWSRLDLIFNWKFYWPRNDSAVILHAHGPKPDWKFPLTASEETLKPLINDHFYEHEKLWIAARDAIDREDTRCTSLA